MAGRGRVRIGTSGWVYRHWRGVFYPPRLRVGDWFAYYAHHFNTTEINNTFYRLPSVAAVSAWRDQALPAFFMRLRSAVFSPIARSSRTPKGRWT
jgi:uncharacterized protein YecE (DUF72 family)